MGNQQVEVQRTPLPNREEASLRVASQTNKILVQCSACKEVLYGRDWIRNLCVCSQCNYHFPLTARERIGLLVDAGSFMEVGADLQTTGLPMGNRHALRGPEPGKEECLEERHQEAVVIGCASIEDRPIALAVMDARFRDGKRGRTGGEKIRCAIERAIQRQVPLLICTASEETCTQEGEFWWLQLASAAAAMARLGETGIPCFSVLTDPSVGAALSVAMLADVILAEPGCQVGCASPSVVEEGMALPRSTGAFTAEARVQQGFIDAIVHRRELRKAVGRLLQMYRYGHPSPRSHRR